MAIHKDRDNPAGKRRLEPLQRLNVIRPDRAGQRFGGIGIGVPVRQRGNRLQRRREVEDSDDALSARPNDEDILTVLEPGQEGGFAVAVTGLGNSSGSPSRTTASRSIGPSLGYWTKSSFSFSILAM